jgi:integrase/recombinase XerC
MTALPTSPTADEVEVARLLLARLGVRPEDLLAVPHREPARQRPPTFSEYIAVLIAGRPPGPRVYFPYWKRIDAMWGVRRLDEPTPSQVRAFLADMKANDVVTSRSNYRGGVGAERHMIGAFRYLYRRAEADGLITAAENPAQKVQKPRRLVSTRHSLPIARLAEINACVAATGDDPALDSLLLRFHVETGCRQCGALALRPCDLDREQCLVRLREKGGAARWQPVSPTLMKHLIAHVEERGAPSDGPLFRYRNGRRIGRRRYEYIWGRVARHLPWAATQGITAHWIRHTTLTWVERNYGYAVARAYAGHAGQGAGGELGTTFTYVKATLGEVATALGALTGEPHPLADMTGDDDATQAP